MPRWPRYGAMLLYLVRYDLMKHCGGKLSFAPNPCVGDNPIGIPDDNEACMLVPYTFKHSSSLSTHPLSFSLFTLSLNSCHAGCSCLFRGWISCRRALLPAGEPMQGYVGPAGRVRKEILRSPAGATVAIDCCCSPSTTTYNHPPPPPTTGAAATTPTTFRRHYPAATTYLLRDRVRNQD